jgi:hypothetical protein
MATERPMEAIASSAPLCGTAGMDDPSIVLTLALSYRSPVLHLLLVNAASSSWRAYLHK